MNKKTYQSPIELKADGPDGSFRAIFSTFNVIDHDGDVTLPGAFEDGQKVRIAYWGHRWSDLPVGKGVIHADEEKAWVDGIFFLDTEGGRETYLTVKNMGDLQEYSYGFDILKSSFGKFEDQEVRFLETMVVHEVSPVMLGAGIGTGTVAIKSAGDGASDDADETDEGQTGDDGVPSGVSPQVILTQLNLDELEMES
jgi:HK97 family phage prohead protease